MPQTNQSQTPRKEPQVARIASVGGWKPNLCVLVQCVLCISVRKGVVPKECMCFF